MCNLSPPSECIVVCSLAIAIADYGLVRESLRFKKTLGESLTLGTKMHFGQQVLVYIRFHVRPDIFCLLEGGILVC